MAALLEIQNLKKHFKSAAGMVHAVDDVTFSLEEGETVGLVGESGCGKSTLGRTLIHLNESTDGRIIYKGRDVTKLNKKELQNYRRDVQMIFQDPFSSLDPRQTVQDIIKEPMKLLGTMSESDLKDRTSELMKTAGIEKRLRMCYPHELDGGRRQRVSTRAESQIHRMRRTGFRSGCVNPGSDSESADGSAGSDGTYLLIYHPRHVSRKAYIQSDLRDVSWTDRREM